MSCLCGSGSADEEPRDRHWAPQSLPEQPPLLRTYARARSLRSTFITMSDGVKIAVDVTLPLVRLSKRRATLWRAPLLSPLRLVCHCVRNSARLSKLPARVHALHCSARVSSAFLGCAQTASQRSPSPPPGPWQYASFAAHSFLRTFQLCRAHNPAGAAVWQHSASSRAPLCPALKLASRATRRASGLTVLLLHVATAAPGGFGGR